MFSQCYQATAFKMKPEILFLRCHICTFVSSVIQKVSWYDLYLVHTIFCQGLSLWQWKWKYCRTSKPPCLSFKFIWRLPLWLIISHCKAKPLVSDSVLLMLSSWSVCSQIKSLMVEGYMYFRFDMSTVGRNHCIQLFNSTRRKTWWKFEEKLGLHLRNIPKHRKEVLCQWMLFALSPSCKLIILLDLIHCSYNML